MKIEFTGRNFTVSPAIKKHTQEHFAKLDSLLTKATSAHVILSVEKHHRHTAEIVIYWRERELTSTASTADMYQSVAQAINKLHRQAQKLKQKLIARGVSLGLDEAATAAILDLVVGKKLSR